ncbi:hypothetical protein CEE59_05940 [Stenotrophomonas maltophilia]|nr:hypothetical protein CEE59_05940 [Stenotrophomonas maltophilia]HEP1206760.1 hypothetical protein [Stenotrophomonas maltophilia]
MFCPFVQIIAGFVLPVLRARIAWLNFGRRFCLGRSWMWRGLCNRRNRFGRFNFRLDLRFNLWCCLRFNTHIFWFNSNWLLFNFRFFNDGWLLNLLLRTFGINNRLIAEHNRHASHFIKDDAFGNRVACVSIIDRCPDKSIPGINQYARIGLIGFVLTRWLNVVFLADITHRVDKHHLTLFGNHKRLLTIDPGLSKDRRHAVIQDRTAFGFEFHDGLFFLNLFDRNCCGVVAGPIQIASNHTSNDQQCRADQHNGFA